ncbi:E3 UFM1-protein ligase 1-like protein [Vigna angularis]|uniref:E3 UFM1-protein ligase 1-like protein n=1 Tax=Phaseolus angularis TaxID=3914 RepID=A0A8T0LEI4_PHAAN|nr:E3 UFM1-protein ligase 1-like protein [Vigna angularis]
MDNELLELQRQIEFLQQPKSSIRLSERNVVELVQKLQQLQIIDFELLHTVSDKEYITLNNNLGLLKNASIHIRDSSGVTIASVGHADPLFPPPSYPFPLASFRPGDGGKSECPDP